jgi:hypothetical protein
MVGLEHCHVLRDGEEVRVPDVEQSLSSIREALVLSNLETTDDSR